jgi:hypothetical protein
MLILREAQRRLEIDAGYHQGEIIMYQGVASLEYV